MSTKDVKKYITLEEILKSDASYDIYVKALDSWVTIRNANTFDRIEAEKLAHFHPSWDKMTNAEKDLEIGRMIALVIMENPKISYEEYKKTNDTTMQIIMATVSNDYSTKIAKLNEQHGVNMRAFLQAILGEDLVNSLTSSNSIITTSTEQPVSGEK